MQTRSTRLNRENKAKFVQAVLNDRLDHSKRPTIEQFQARWNNKIYDLIYGDHLENMAKLPDWFFVTDKSMSVNMLGDRRSAVSFDLPKPVRHCRGEDRYHSHTCPTAPQDHAIVTDYKNVMQQQNDFDLKHRELRNQLMKLVDSCNTSAQLYKSWPEAEKFAECFPYRGPERFEKAAVSKKEIEIGLLLASTIVTAPTED